MKSAYFNIMEVALPVPLQHHQNNWKAIWEMQIPNKIEVFLWRLSSGCLPTRHRLQSRGVPCTRICSFYQNNFENSLHYFVGCQYVKKYWVEYDLWNIIWPHVERTYGFFELVFALLGGYGSTSICHNLKKSCPTSPLVAQTSTQ